MLLCHLSTSLLQKHFKRQEQQQSSNRRRPSLFDIVHPDDRSCTTSWSDSRERNPEAIETHVPSGSDASMNTAPSTAPDVHIVSRRAASTNSSFSSTNSTPSALFSHSNSFSSTSDFQQYCALACNGATNPVPPDSVTKPIAQRVGPELEGAPAWASRLLAACHGNSTSERFQNESGKAGLS